MKLATRFGFIFFVLIFSGCVSNAPGAQPLASVPPVPEAVLSNPIPSPGEPLTLCIGENLTENHECFEHAFLDCQRAVGIFWSTSDGIPLHFESQGLDAEGNCRVRVNILSDSNSLFAGQSANCSIPQTPAMTEEGELTPDGSVSYDVYSIGPHYCVGTFVDSIKRTADPAPAPPPELTPQPSGPAIREFTVKVGESGVQGEKELMVKKGERVRITFMVDTQDVSFNGEQILAPVQKGLPADQYLFDTGQILPGKSKTVEFIAVQTIEFGIYWPGPSVLKGKGKIIAEEN